MVGYLKAKASEACEKFDFQVAPFVPCQEVIYFAINYVLYFQRKNPLAILTCQALSMNLHHSLPPYQEVWCLRYDRKWPSRKNISSHLVSARITFSTYLKNVLLVYPLGMQQQLFLNIHMMQNWREKQGNWFFNNISLCWWWTFSSPTICPGMCPLIQCVLIDMPQTGSKGNNNFPYNSSFYSLLWLNCVWFLFIPSLVILNCIVIGSWVWMRQWNWIVYHTYWEALPAFWISSFRLNYFRQQSLIFSLL